MKQTIWLATGNAHKKEEFEQILSDAVIKTLKDLDHKVEIEETGTTFEENALIKARALYDVVKEPVIADDSGLEVDALDGAPGIYSARFMGEDTPYPVKNQWIIDAVEGKERTARFVCALAYIDEKGEEHVYRGVMEGLINDKIVGEHGFGYDPIFYFPLFGTTNGNVDADLKNAHSHRANAIAMFLEEREKEERRKAE